MKKLNLNDVRRYVEENIDDFHSRRIARLDQLKLHEVLQRKNPYLFKAKYFLEADVIIESLLHAHISSSEETLFGEWLEGLAVFINTKVYDGRKSGIDGIDLEIDKDGIRYIVSIKSGPNWGNSQAIARMLDIFTKAKRTLKTSNSKLHIEAVNGCCYGNDDTPYKKQDYYKYCGQRFWTFISGEETLYTDIIEPLGHTAMERNREYQESYAKIKNRFVADFTRDFCFEDGSIHWEKLVQFNSGKRVEVSRHPRDKTTKKKRG